MSRAFLMEFLMGGGRRGVGNLRLPNTPWFFPKAPLSSPRFPFLLRTHKCMYLTIPPCSQPSRQKLQLTSGFCILPNCSSVHPAVRNDPWLLKNVLKSVLLRSTLLSGSTSAKLENPATSSSYSPAHVEPREHARNPNALGVRDTRTVVQVPQRM